MISTLSKKHDFDIVFDSQAVFRLILEAVANPGRILSIKEYADKLYDDYPALLTMALTLLDNEVGFIAYDNSRLSDEIVSLTLARRETMDSADYIFVCDPESMKYVMENAKCGTLADPHKSATVIIQNDGEAVCRLKLSGPGIKDCLEVQTTQTVKDAMLLRDMQYYEYPQGIDLLFLSSQGDLLAVPRLTHLETEVE